MRAVITSLAVIALAAACGHRPAPVPAAEADRPPDCPPDSVGARDSGIALGSDVYRGPRYSVDSSGRVETLPPVPARADSTRPDSGCRRAPHGGADSGLDSTAGGER
jgi:hypothetical protein